jgi:uncharacterized membrane protein YqjE
MDAQEEILEDRPEPGWKERVGAVRRAASALFTTRAAIFREELSEKGSLLAKAAGGLAIAAAFGFFALVLLTALVAALFARLLGGPIAGITAALVLYLAIAVTAALLGGKTLGRVRGLAFPATRDEIRRDLDAIRQHAGKRDEEPAGADAMAAERASVGPEEVVDEEDSRDAEEGERRIAAMGDDVEERFRAGSE